MTVVVDFCPVGKCTTILALLCISNEKLHNAMLACKQSKHHHTAENIVTQFEEIFSNFEIISKWLSVLLDECSSLIGVVY